MKWFTPSPFGRRHRFAFIAGAEKIRVLTWVRNGGWAIVLTSRSSRSNRNSAKWEFTISRDWFRIHMMNKHEYNQFSLRKVLLEKVQYMHLYILAISHIFTIRDSLLRLCIIMLFQVWAEDFLRCRYGRMILAKHTRLLRFQDFYLVCFLANLTIFPNPHSSPTRPLRA